MLDKATKWEVGLMKQLLSGSNLNWYRIKSIAALFTGAAILFLGCKKNNIEEIKAIASVETLPMQEARNFESLFTDSGQVRFSIKAPLLLRFENDGQDYIEFPNGLELVKFDQNNKVISSITANYARQYVAEQKWEAKNNVVATNANGDTLKTEVLYWEEKERKIYTNEFVRIIRADQNFTGTGMTSDQNMMNWKITNPKGTLYVNMNNQSQPSDSMKMQNQNNKTNSEPLKRPLQFNNQIP
jgi:LPS export ABC transporter protein LptC